MAPRFIQITKFFLALASFGCGISLIFAASLYLYLSPKLPSPETLRSVKLQTPLRIYSQDKQLIATFGEKKRNPLRFEEIPTTFIQAILSAEDDNFYHHKGVDLTGLLRAAVELVSTGHIQSGGSTITMQLARNFFLSTEQSFIRKFNEILLALRIEDDFDKQDILTLYANKIYLGNRAYGIGAAAQVYYGKSIDTLSLPQLAMIAGLPKAPSAFNPLTNPQRALERRNWILGRMLKLGYITQEQHFTAVNTVDDSSYHNPSTELDAPYIAEMARQEAIDRLGMAAYTEGYQVITTVDSHLQAAAQNALRNGLEDYDWRHGYRGPEKHIKNQEQWRKTLQKTPDSSSLIPAIVTQVNGQELTFILRDGLEAKLLIQDEYPVRQFISENRRSAPIQDFGTLFKVGDLIRVRKTEDNAWRLTQIPKAQSALVSLAPDSGAIRALSGGYDFYLSHFNRAVQAERQPGSNFKPFIYTKALESGMTAATTINDAPVVFNDPSLEKAWRPENDSGKFYGPTRLRKALYLSRNLVSIRILRQLGVKRVIRSVGRFGFDETSLPPNLSLALGTQAATPLSIANGYATFANGGYRVNHYLIESILDADDNPVYQANPAIVCYLCEQNPEGQPSPPDEKEPDSLQALFAEQQPADTQATEAGNTLPEKPPRAQRIVDPRVAYIMDSILKDVIKRGTGTKALILKRGDIAGKTGTTNGPRDAWFSGYSPHLATTVWVGFDENLLLGRNEYGGSAALPIWIDFMGEALKNQPEIHRPQPAGLVTAKIDPATGQRVGPGYRGGIFEYFLQENLPPFAAGGQQGQPSSTPSSLPENLF